MTMFPERTFEDRVREYMRMGVTTPPFVADEAWNEAQRRLGGRGGLPQTLQSIVQLLRNQAQPRPDLGGGRPYTLAGRVGMPGESALQMLSRMPQGELESGGSVLGNLKDPLTLATIQNILKKKQLAEAVTEGPLNPRDLVLTAEQKAMQQKLPVAARSFQTPEDVARRAAGEVLPEHGTALPDVPREPVRGSLEFFQQMLRKLGL